MIDFYRDFALDYDAPIWDTIIDGGINPTQITLDTTPVQLDRTYGEKLKGNRNVYSERTTISQDGDSVKKVSASSLQPYGTGR